MDPRASELQVRFINERINHVEKHFADLCQDLSNYNKKLARTRDKADDLVQDLIRFANSERLNTTLKQGMLGFADCLAAVQDYRHAQVQRLDSKVIQYLATYGTICKHAKEDLRGNSSLLSREVNRRSQLDRARGRYPPNWQTISKVRSIAGRSSDVRVLIQGEGFLSSVQAENDFHKASTEALQSTKTLEHQMDDFERKKLLDIKQVLLEFVNIHILFHAKALELYTKAYQSVESIDEEQDLEDFRSCLRVPSSSVSRLSTIRSGMFRSTPNLPLLEDETLARGSGNHSLRTSPRLGPRRSLTTAFTAKHCSDESDSDERTKHLTALKPNRR